MTSRIATLRRLAILLMLPLLAPPAALAQAVGGPAAPAGAQAPAAAGGSGLPRTAPTPATPPSRAASRQASGKAAKPASTIAANAPTATTPPASTTTRTPPAYSGRAYDIEIVVFRAKVALGQPENWAAETNAGATVAGAEASSGSGAIGKLLAVLPSSDYRLTSIASRLRSSGTYLPVAHAAWVQTASAWGTRAGFSLQSLGINVPGLTGVVFFERGEFLHLGMTLDYTMQNPPPGLNAPPGTAFVMNETRRVRFYQRNYYDHPAFGVIALVTPARGPRPPGR
ncbi:MAG TPA: CsiV family protein [Steroidobacteraceae bacterium]|nr:CsiV family protein [Steroidobacteraceae bacterium]